MVRCEIQISERSDFTCGELFGARACGETRIFQDLCCAYHMQVQPSRFGEDSCQFAKDFCHYRYLYVVSLPSLCFCGRVNYSRDFSHIGHGSSLCLHFRLKFLLRRTKG